MEFHISNLHQNDLADAASVWERGWHEAHSAIVPIELVRSRTSESFIHRLRSNLKFVRVYIENGHVLGLCMIKEDELYQMYTAPQARGTGLAQVLMTDAEQRLMKAGYSLGWLSCAVGNDRAARFYDKSGWKNVGLRTVEFEALSGVFPFQVWRYEKSLS
ncbi:GNAT family N-acetyltransferase [uncultured Tateyamaria sp.]|nr:GNAT family N-acetyltransferase [uncultured Tateyamaria sp.]